MFVVFTFVVFTFAANLNTNRAVRTEKRERG